MQIPALVERSIQRARNFFADLDERLQHSPFVAAENFSAADITALVTVDFAKALDIAPAANQQALKRWYAVVSSRSSASA